MAASKNQEFHKYQSENSWFHHVLQPKEHEVLHVRIDMDVKILTGGTSKI